MANCPNCKTQVSDATTSCPNCGARIIPITDLEDVPSKTSAWQKFIIAISVVILIAIGFTYQGAAKREDKAAQEIFGPSLNNIITNVAMQTGLSNTFGIPAYTLKAQPKSAEVFLDFPKGPMSARQAQFFANAVSGLLARTYVNKGYMPRSITVWIASAAGNGKKIIYGKSVYNGNLDAIGWEPEAQ